MLCETNLEMHKLPTQLPEESSSVGNNIPVPCASTSDDEIEGGDDQEKIIEVYIAPDESVNIIDTVIYCPLDQMYTKEKIYQHETQDTHDSRQTNTSAQFNLHVNIDPQPEKSSQSMKYVLQSNLGKALAVVLGYTDEVRSLDNKHQQLTELEKKRTRTGTEN
jgi:hypothetical protein